MRDYLPRRDEGFDTFQKNFIKKLEPKLAEWEISTTEFDSLLQLQTAGKTAWEKAKDKDKRTRGDISLILYFKKYILTFKISRI